MLSDTLENSMKKAMKYENLTKASKFSKNNNFVKNEKSPEKELLMLQKLSKYVKECEQEISQKSDFSELKKENFQEKEIILEEDKTIKNLPFFKSIEYKLSEVFCV